MTISCYKRLLQVLGIFENVFVSILSNVSCFGLVWCLDDEIGMINILGKREEAWCHYALVLGMKTLLFRVMLPRFPDWKDNGFTFPYFILWKEVTKSSQNSKGGKWSPTFWRRQYLHILFGILQKTSFPPLNDWWYQYGFVTFISFFESQSNAVFICFSYCSGFSQLFWFGPYTLFAYPLSFSGTTICSRRFYIFPAWLYNQPFL